MNTGRLISFIENVIIDEFESNLDDYQNGYVSVDVIWKIVGKILVRIKKDPEEEDND